MGGIEPFKNKFSLEAASGISDALVRAWPAFDRRKFLRGLGEALEPLELKDRMLLLADRLEEQLPGKPAAAFKILCGALAEDDSDLIGLSGFAVWPLGEIVSRRGLGDFSAAMKALREITKRFTSEFAIRPFLRDRLHDTLEVLTVWATDPNEHVRRLVSEGSRPLLPWGERLPAIMENPQMTLPLLDRLWNDPSDYVRRSVANHLNDFSKQHPEVVLKTLGRWKKSGGPHFERLAKHAARTLLKKGHPQTLEFFGFYHPEYLIVETFEISPESLRLGDSLTYQFSVRNSGKTKVSVLFDYAIHHQKKDGRLTQKVFKGKTRTLSAGESLVIAGQHVIRPVTTRTYHAGTHHLEIFLNGRSFDKKAFQLVLTVPNSRR